jgi:MFS family permease
VTDHESQVFYQVGFSGIGYILEIIVADTSSLRNRSLAFAFQTSPYIATAFAGPKAAEGFYTNISWRWAFGTFAILVPVLCFPNWYILYYNQRKANKQGLLNREPSGRTMLQSIWHYIVEFDGMILYQSYLLCASYKANLQ